MSSKPAAAVAPEPIQVASVEVADEVGLIRLAPFDSAARAGDLRDG